MALAQILLELCTTQVQTYYFSPIRGNNSVCLKINVFKIVAQEYKPKVFMKFDGSNTDTFGVTATQTFGNGRTSGRPDRQTVGQV